MNSHVLSKHASAFNSLFLGWWISRSIIGDKGLSLRVIGDTSKCYCFSQVTYIERCKQMHFRNNVIVRLIYCTSKMKLGYYSVL
jgi:hypothetical protein